MARYFPVPTFRLADLSPLAASVWARLAIAALAAALLWLGVLWALRPA